MGPGDLAQVLRPLTLYDHPNLLVGLKTSDDAAVYRLNDTQAIVQTVDFFPPVVDEPYAYGAIAAANAMSDVYAMGGEVLVALNVAAFPDTLPMEIITSIFQGGADKVAEAGGVIAGGHTITDDEPKYGLAVAGLVDPRRVITKAAARPGDLLALTKPLGTGVITTALRGGVADPEHVAAAVDSMLTLNRRAARLMQEMGIRAATDITGFGLLGHAAEMVTASGVGIRFFARRIPLLPGALDYSRQGLLPGGAWRNRAHLLAGSPPLLRWSDTVPSDLLDLLYDPETSGGLLIAVPAERSEEFRARFEEAGQPYWFIGEVVEGHGIMVEAQ